jgi:hypothetical protein
VYNGYQFINLGLIFTFGSIDPISPMVAACRRRQLIEELQRNRPSWLVSFLLSPSEGFHVQVHQQNSSRYLASPVRSYPDYYPGNQHVTAGIGCR